QTPLHFLHEATSEEQTERTDRPRRLDVDGVRLAFVEHEVGSVVHGVVAAANIVMSAAPGERFDGEQPHAVPVMLAGRLVQDMATARVQTALYAKSSRRAEAAGPYCEGHEDILTWLSSRGKLAG